MILVLLEQVEGTLSRSALQVVMAAKQAAEANGIAELKAVILGSEAACKQAAAEAASFGFAEVVYCSSDLFAERLVLPATTALQQIIEQLQPKLFLAGATSFAKAVLPRLAAMFDAGMASDVTGFLPAEGQDRVFERPMFAGNIIAEVAISTPLVIATVRSAAFDPAVAGAATAAVRQLSIPLTADAREQFVSFDTVKSERPELNDAQVVISGGRALQSKENFDKYLLPLADSLHAALGASRAAVDSGYAPNDWQIGQTGKVVAPSLYIAVGISGAIQHLAGMKDSKVIVAINTDAEAPIFEIADYGLVADLHQAVPELTEAIRNLSR